MSKFELSPTLNLEGRIVGAGCPAFIIAEIGVNHNGDPTLGEKMIDAAAEAGVDCVKFQTFRAEEFMADRDLEYQYESAGKLVRENMFKMFKRLEMSAENYERLFAYARKKKLIPFTSVADVESAELIEKIGIAGFKLASEDLINSPLLKAISQKGRPMIISTGMADEAEVKNALKMLEVSNNPHAVFLHCVSVYPTPPDQTNLYRMLALQQVTGGSVGYSDHTLGIEACVGAAALGACILEKHFTLDRTLPGPDQNLSSDPKEMAALVQAIRKVESMRGVMALKPADAELKTRIDFRRSIVASRNLSAGTVLQAGDLALKRPATGLHPSLAPTLLGKAITRDISQDQIIRMEDLIS